MNFKINKDKEISKTQRPCWILTPSNNNVELKGKNISNCTILNTTIQGNHKFVKLRRNSNFNPKNQERCELETLKTICAKRISLCDNRQKSKNKNCRSASSHYQKSILLQSNFDMLKQQARKLEQEQGCYGVHRWGQVNSQTQDILNQTGINFSRAGTNQNQNTIKRHKKSNIRKIIKGRPQIKKLLEQNRQRTLKQRTIQYSQQCILTISQQKQKQNKQLRKRDIQNLESIDINIQVIKKKCNIKNGHHYRLSSGSYQPHNLHSRIKNYIHTNNYQPIMHTIL